MWKDPIVDEVRRIRDEYAARFDYDLNAIFRDLKEREAESVEPVVRLKREPCDGEEAVPTVASKR